MRTYVICLLAVFFTSSAQSKSPVQDGNSLAKHLETFVRNFDDSSRLKTEEKLQWLAISNYLDGFLGECVAAQINKANCGYKLPVGIGLLQFAKVVEKYLADRPSLLHEDWGTICYSALIDAFPPSD